MAALTTSVKKKTSLNDHEYVFVFKDDESSNDTQYFSVISTFLTRKTYEFLSVILPFSSL